MATRQNRDRLPGIDSGFWKIRAFVESVSIVFGRKSRGRRAAETRSHRRYGKTYTTSRRDVPVKIKSRPVLVISSASLISTEEKICRPGSGDAVTRRALPLHTLRTVGKTQNTTATPAFLNLNRPRNWITPHHPSKSVVHKSREKHGKTSIRFTGFTSNEVNMIRHPKSLLIRFFTRWNWRQYFT